MVERENIFPAGMPKRIVKGHVLYTPVVTVVPGKLVFVSGILSRKVRARSSARATWRRKFARCSKTSGPRSPAAGAGMSDIVKRQTFTTDIDAYFENIDARMEHGGDNLSTSTTVEVRRLSHPDFLIEVEVMAIIPGEIRPAPSAFAARRGRRSRTTKATPISPPSRQTTWHSR